MTSLLGWCVRHIVLIVIAGFVLVGLFYREEIFCRGTEQPEVADTISSEHAEQGQSVEPTLGAGPVEHDGATDSDEVSSEMKGEGQQVEKNAAEETAAEETRINAVVDEQIAAAEKSLIEEEANAYSFRSEPGSAGNEPSQAKLKQKARAAYWRGDETAAVEYYRQLVELNPADPDAHGELGNILLKLGSRTDALNEYRSAISIMIEQGEVAQALSLVNAVSDEFPEKVQDLREQLETSGSDGD